MPDSITNPRCVYVIAPSKCCIVMHTKASKAHALQRVCEAWLLCPSCGTNYHVTAAVLHRLYVRDKRKLKTQIKQNTTKPVWNEEFQLLVNEPEHQHLSLHMLDHDMLSVDDEIGRASFPIRNLRNGEEQEVDLEVKEEVGEKVDQMMVSGVLITVDQMMVSVVLAEVDHMMVSTYVDYMMVGVVLTV